MIVIDVPYRWFYRIEDYLRNPKYFWRTLKLWMGNIDYICRCLKWCWQRAFRGWADCDWWGMDSYLVDIIIPMLKKMKGGAGYPGCAGASTPEEWSALLDEMIEGFEAARRVIDLDYPNKDTRQWLVLEKADQKLFKERMKLFTKWFFALWD